MFRYRLIVVTHGIGDTLGATLASFRAHVTPLPTDAYMHADGEIAWRHQQEQAIAFPEWDWRLGRTAGQHGFCYATGAAWGAATDAPRDNTHVFWLEHDFRFQRHVDLEALARAMALRAASGQKLAQMSLMRQPVNDAERAAGTILTDFEPQGGWLEHDAYFTTNPSLMTRSFMEANRWPREEKFCEGVFGVHLKRSGYRFGVWGHGEPWVNHFGVRTGHGY